MIRAHTHYYRYLPSSAGTGRAGLNPVRRFFGQCGSPCKASAALHPPITMPECPRAVLMGREYYVFSDGEPSTVALRFSLTIFR